MTALPRSVLDRLETSDRLAPRTPPDELESWMQKARELRVALVRQDVFQDLYCAGAAVRGPELVRQSVRRTGPAGFVVDLQADYWIVKEDPAPECAIWAEKIAHDPDPQPDAYRAKKDLIPAEGFRTSFGQNAVAVDEIPWENYDLVVTVDIAVPFRILEKTSRPVWAYLPGDPGVPTAKRSLKSPPGNYDMALTHSFRRYPVRPGLGAWTVEFPYTFLRQATWQKVFPAGPNRERLGTMVEHQTESLLSSKEKKELERLGPVRRPEGSILEVADRLNRSCYYFRCGGGPIVGNGLVEAAAAGCVAVGNPREFVSRSLFGRENLCFSRSRGITRLQSLEADRSALARARRLQGSLVDYFCFYRPLHEICKIRRRRVEARRGKPVFSFPALAPRDNVTG